MKAQVFARNLVLAFMAGGLAMQVAVAIAAPPTTPGGGGASSCEATYTSCKSHCKTYSYGTSAFQTCIDNCKKQHDTCKSPTGPSPK